MAEKKQGRLMTLRVLGMTLVLATAGIIWHNQTGRNPKELWEIRNQTGNDLYALGGSWSDHEGTQRSLEEFRGKVSVISFVFTECRTACPVLMGELKQFETLLDAPKAGLDFVAFILDDGPLEPRALQAFRQSYGIEKAYWHTLTASKDVLDTLTRELQVRYETRGGETPVFMHTNLIGIIGPDGKVVILDYGWKNETAEMVKKILKALDQV